MKVVKFRIKNYKSIIDSGDCYFSEKITILAGKNESGKTSVLEALEDFNKDASIRETAKHLNTEEIPEVPEISVTFEIDKESVNKILREAESPEITKETVNVTLIKKYILEGYKLHSETRSLLGIPEIYKEHKDLIISLLDDIKKEVEGQQAQVPELKDKQFIEFRNEVNEFQTLINESNFKQKDSISEKITKILNAIDIYSSQQKIAKRFVEIFVRDKLPSFILFSSFDDIFPEFISMESLADDHWALDLQEVSSFEIEKITSTNEQTQENHERSANVDFSKKFLKFWTQDNIKLEIDKDGDILKFRIIENNISYKPEQRSKGQQWYLSFYIKIVSKINDNKPNIILIDEPGLYLHAKAQKDLLNVLKEHSSDYPIVFSTHSPYLIEPDDLESVRLVEKKDNTEGSKILGKIHAHARADKETITPILTAIGLGLNDSILNIEQKNNVIVEGPADVFYLQAFKKLCSNKLNINFVSGGGASNMGLVGTILEGWGANVLYLHDNDTGKTQGEKRLDSWKVLPEQIKEVLKTKDTAIEDIFSTKDFKKHVLKNETLTFKIKNSKHVKNKDKVLLARKFLQNVKSGSIMLDDESKKNIDSLFECFQFNHENR